MHTYERDYRYLLLHLLPRHRLSSELRGEIDRALVGGSTADLRRTSVRALEELCDALYYERTGIESVNGNVLIGYRRRDGGYRVTVAVPHDESPLSVLADGETDRAHGPSEDPGRPGTREWGDGSGEQSATATAQPGVTPPGPPDVSKEAAGPPPAVSPGETAGPPAAGRRVADRASDERAGDAVGYLPEIIRTFAITDRTDPILGRLDTLLDTLHRWLSLRGAALDVIDDVVGRDESDFERVRVMTEAELVVTPLYADAIDSASAQLVPRAQAGVEERRAAPGWAVAGIAPITGMGRVLGVLTLYFGEGVSRESMRAQLDVAANVVHQVIDFHSQIADLTSVDALTGIYNRHFFDVQLPVEVERAMRSGSEVALLMLDIDDFKRINDELGHRKGDEALTAVADIIRRNLRKVDIPFRYGGEEIVILLPGTSRFESVHTAERLRRRIGEHDAFRDLHGRSRRITVSVGVGVYPETARTAEELFLQADAAMYRAKETGKNRVVLYSEGMAMGRDRS